MITYLWVWGQGKQGGDIKGCILYSKDNGELAIEE